MNGSDVIAGPGKTKSLPRGIRNNNPGNIRSGSIKWVGQIDKDDKGFCIFSSHILGLRALVKLLDTYAKTYKLNTVKKIITRWAPSTENDTGAYIESVAKTVGVAAEEKIDYQAPTNHHILLRLVIGIVMHENGQQPYTMQDIDTAIDLARRA